MGKNLKALIEMTTEIGHDVLTIQPLKLSSWLQLEHAITIGIWGCITIETIFGTCGNLKLF